MLLLTNCGISVGTLGLFSPFFFFFLQLTWESAENSLQGQIPFQPPVLVAKLGEAPPLRLPHPCERKCGKTQCRSASRRHTRLPAPSRTSSITVRATSGQTLGK